MGIYMGKRKCVVCVMDSDGKILEESSYDNTSKAASGFAKRILLRASLVAKCHIGSAASRGMKQILRYQMSLVQDRTRAINYVHTLTDKYDINPKDGGFNVWSERVLRYLEGTDGMACHDRFILEQSIPKIRHYNDKIKLTQEQSGITSATATPRRYCRA